MISNKMKVFARFFSTVAEPVKVAKSRPIVPVHVLQTHISPGAYFSIIGGARYYTVEDLKPEPGSQYAYWQELVREAAVEEATLQLEAAKKALEDLQLRGKF